MSENTLGRLGLLHGLEDYFEFTKDNDARLYIRFILKLMYADNPTIVASESGSMQEFFYTFRKFSSAPLLPILSKYYRLGHNPVALEDAYSRGQVQSKIWLADELAKVKSDFNNIHIYAGWYGQLLRYFDTVNITYNKARIIDLDPNACQVSDKIFNLDQIENFRVKAVCCPIDDININSEGIALDITTSAGQVFNEHLTTDLIINSSSEHMSDDWFVSLKSKKIETNPIVVIQSNNLFDIPEHINCVRSVNHMMKKFPMEEIYYSGSLKLAKYKRFMLIGRLNARA